VTVIQNTVTDPGGEPLAQIGVRITLQTGAPSTPGYVSSGEIGATYSGATDANGHWTANLTANSLITPANTFYQVVEGSSISNIVVPASGGPYLLGSILVTPPPTPSAVGITGLAVASAGTIAGTRPELNLIAGSNVTVSAADNPGANRVDVTVTSTASGGLQPANNLSDVASPATSFANIKQAATTGATGVVQFDGIATDIQPTGVPVAGAIGKAADAGHTHPYEPWQFYVKAYGAKGDNATDDTASIRSAIAAAFNYAAANNGYAEILFDPLTYLLSAAPITGATFNGATFNGSAQLPIPAQPQTSQKLILVFRGTRDQTALYHWLQTTPQRAGTVLRSTWNAGNTLGGAGYEASVIGGPTPRYMGDPPSTWSNELVVIDGITIEISNFNICGFDFRNIAEANVINGAVLATSLVTGAPAIPPANWAFGLAMPVVNNNDCANIGWFSVEGMVYGVIAYEHLQAASLRIINCFDGLIIWSSSGFPHRNHIDYASIEGCQRCIVYAGGFNKLDIDVCDIEWGAGFIIDDVGTTPGLGRIGLCSNGSSGASLSAALNTSPTNVNVANGALAMEITNIDQALGPVTPPSIPASGTPLTNPFWRQAEVTIVGGTVTQIAVDGSNRLITSGTVTVPSGHSITLTYSAAPSWAWTLKK
jgi:hypothetical protein